MDVLSIVVYAATLAFTGIVLWYVVEFLPIPAHMKRVAQLLLVLVLVLDVLRAVSGAHPMSSGLVPSRPLSPSTPSIIK